MALLLVCCLLAWLGRDAAADATSLAGADAASTGPQGWSAVVLVYLWLPLTFLANVVLWWAPGVCLALVFLGTRRWTQTLLGGFLLSYLVHGVTAVGLKVVGPVPLDLDTYVFASLGVVAVCGGLLAWAVRRGEVAERVRSLRADTHVLVAAVVMVLGVSVGWAPLLSWQDPNADGLESLYMGWSLRWHMLPHTPADTGVLGLGLGAQGLAPMVLWRIAWDGPLDYAGRAVLGMMLPALLAGIVALAEHGLDRRLGRLGIGGVVGGLVVYCVSLVYSGGYDYVAADMSSPAGLDTFFIITVLGSLVYLCQGRIGLFMLAYMLAVISRPTSLLLVGGFVAVAMLLWPARRASMTWRMVLVLVTTAALAWVHERYYLGGEMEELRASVTSRLRFLQFTDLGRFWYLAVPCGLLPMASLLWFRRMDPLGRCLALVCVGYSLFMYTMAFVSLHHFVPGMILFLCLFWRCQLRSGARARRPLAWAALACCVPAFMMALPPSLEVSRVQRERGAAIRFEAAPGDLDAVFAAAYALAEVTDGEGQLDSHAILASATAVVRTCDPGQGPQEPRFILRRRDGDAVPGWVVAARSRGWECLVPASDPGRRLETEPVDYVSPWLKVKPEVLFRHLGEPAGRFAVDLKQLLP